MTMNDGLHWLQNSIQGLADVSKRLSSFYLVKVSFVFLLALVSYFIIRSLVKRFLSAVNDRLPQQVADIAQYFLFYGIYGLFMMILLQTMHVDLSAVIAAAGVTGIAVGFAAKTSLSNIISGIMLVLEGSIRVGDLIQCNGVQGKVQSIDLLSITLKTVDNTLIRIPNEKLLEGNVVNKYAYKTRRVCYRITIDPQKQDIQKALELVMSCANNFSLRSKTTDPDIGYDASSEFALGLTLSLWIPAKQVVAAQSGFVKECSEQAAKEGVSLFIGLK